MKKMRPLEEYREKPGTVFWSDARQVLAYGDLLDPAGVIRVEEYAWKHGHANGWFGVYEVLCDIDELLQDIHGSLKPSDAAAACQDVAVAAEPPLLVREIRGQEAAKRAILVSVVSGVDSMEFCGTPGHGAGMLAEWTEALSAALNLRVPRVRIMPPCPCGGAADPRQSCECTSAQRRDFLKPGTSSVRIDVPPVPFRDLVNPAAAGKSFDELVEEGRRAVAAPRLPVSPEKSAILAQAYAEIGLSPRDVSVTNRLAEAAARIDGKRAVGEAEYAEALNYRLAAVVKI